MHFCVHDKARVMVATDMLDIVDNTILCVAAVASWISETGMLPCCVDNGIIVNKAQHEVRYHQPSGAFILVSKDCSGTDIVKVTDVTSYQSDMSNPLSSTLIYFGWQALSDGRILQHFSSTRP